MPVPKQSRPRRKDIFAEEFKKYGKAILFSESSGRSSLAPNIRSLSWSPTGSLIATCTSSSIRIWNPDKPNVKLSTELRGSSAVLVEKIAFCPTHEALLASTGSDGLCKLWDVRIPGGTATAIEANIGDDGSYLTWHPRGTQLLVGRRDDTVKLVDVRTDSTITIRDSTPPKSKGRLRAMAFSNSGNHLFTTGDGPAKILDWPSLELRHTLPGHADTNVVQQSPTGTYVAVGASDGIVTLWDTLDWTCMHSVVHSSSVRDLSFSFDGAYIVAAGGNGKDSADGSAGIQITHVESGENVLTASTTNPATWVAWHPLRYWLAYVGDPGGLKILGASTLL